MALNSIRNSVFENAPKARSLWQILLDGGFTDRSIPSVATLGDKSERRFPSIDPIDLNAALAVQEDLGSTEGIVRSAAGDRKPLGELMLNARRISYAQLEYALDEQRQSREKLGGLLVRKGWARCGEVNAALEFQQRQGSDASTHSPLKLGAILVNAGHITARQLEDAITRQRSSGKKLGEVLVDAGYAQPHQITRGLKTQRKLIKAALIALLSLSTLTSHDRVDAKQLTTQMGVSTTVLAFAKLHVLQQHSGLSITRNDINRGFIDVPSASHLEIRSNSRDGYQLVVESLAELFKAVQIQGLGGDIELGPEGGTIVQRYPGKSAATMKLSYRFILPSDVRPGNYAWPLALSVRPL